MNINSVSSYKASLLVKHNKMKCAKTNNSSQQAKTGEHKTVMRSNSQNSFPIIRKNLQEIITENLKNDSLVREAQAELRSTKRKDQKTNSPPQNASTDRHVLNSSTNKHSEEPAPPQSVKNYKFPGDAQAALVSLVSGVQRFKDATDPIEQGRIREELISAHGYDPHEQ